VTDHVVDQDLLGLIAPVLAAIGALAALASNFTLEVVRRDEDKKDTPAK
jgi:hypothetical protein